MKFSDSQPFVRKALLGRLDSSKKNDLFIKLKTKDSRLFYILSGSGSIKIEDLEYPSIDPKLKMLIAPYGTNKIVADDRFVAQLRELKCDIIAYQDEVGVEKSTPKQTAEYFKALKAAHDKAGKSRLWADVETFAFEGAQYRSALVPADPDRLKAQLESVSPFVDEIIIYIYQCMMESPDAKATFGQRDAVKLYNRIFK